MRALSIRQPYAELIMRGIKTIEYRSRPTRIIGRRFYIYASKTPVSRPIWSEDLRVGHPPGWMIELAEQVGLLGPDADLATGCIIGSAVIEKVSRNDDIFEWHLKEVKRLARQRKPSGHPQPVWFNPF